MSDSGVETYFRDLNEIAIDESLSLDEKINRVLQLGRDRLNVANGVLSYTRDGEYEIIASVSADGSYTAGSTHDLSSTFCRHTVNDREALAIHHMEDSAYSDDVSHEEAGLQCYIGAPIIVDGEIYGTLCYSGEEPRTVEFTEQEKQFVNLLSRWIGFELERDHHYETLDRQNERLNEFANVLAHDLRNPLTVARGYTELVAESVEEPEAEDLETVLDSLNRMETLITETLALARDGSDVGEREPVGIEPVARAAWDTVDPTDAVLQIESHKQILADRSRLRQLFENLFRNVDEHCGPDTTVTVDNTDDGFVVADDGPGLPEQVAEGLFESDSERDYLGIGLLIVERIISGHEWRGDVTVDDGTQFRITGVTDATGAQTTSA